MIKPAVVFTIEFKCGHKVKSNRADTDEKAEELKQFVLSKFEGLCGECYIKKCKKKGIKPWWEK